MKIAMVSEHANPLTAVGGENAGGQRVHVAGLARALAERGHEVVVHARREAPEQPEFASMAAGVRVHHIDAGPAEVLSSGAVLDHIPELTRGLANAWRRDTPDVVHAHCWMSGLASRGAAGELNLPMALTFHTLGSVKQRYQATPGTSAPHRLEAERTLAREVDRVLATSTHEIDELVAMGGDPDRMEVIPCGVDLTQFRPTGERLVRDASGPVLLTVGRLVPRKGMDDAIRMLVELPECQLIVAGGPPSDASDTEPAARRLRQVAVDLGVADRVTFLGAVGRADMPALIRSADIVVCLPWYEPFGMVPVEAMACGTPVLGSRVGGLVDTVEEGGTGLLVPARDPRAAAAAARRMLAAPGLLRAMEQRGPTRAAELFSWQSVARRTENAYLHLMTGLPSGPSLQVPSARMHSPEPRVGVRPRVGSMRRFHA